MDNSSRVGNIPASTSIASSNGGNSSRGQTIDANRSRGAQTGVTSSKAKAIGISPVGTISTSTINTSTIGTGIGVGTIGSIPKTSSGIRIGTIGSIVGISFRLSLGLPLLSAVDTIRVSSIGTGIGVAIASIGISIGNTPSTGHWQVSRVHTGGTLDASIGNWVASVAIGGIVGVSICLSVGSRHEEGGNNKELHVV